MNKMIVENNIIKYERNYGYSSGDLPEICFKSMKKFKTKIAQYIVETGEEDTFGDLLQRIIRCALKMKSKGLGPGDVILICSYNHKNTCVPFFAGIFLGVKIASVDPITPVNDTAYLIKEVAPKIIFVSTDAVELIENSIKLAQFDYNVDIVVFGDTEKYEKFDEYLVPNGDEESFSPISATANDVPVIAFSSGTTGRPMGICIRNSSLLSGAFNLVNAAGFDQKDSEWVGLNYANFHWISQVAFVIISAIFGMSRVVVKEFNGAGAWELIDKYKVSLLFLNTYRAVELAEVGRPKNINTDSLKYLFTAGVHLARHVLVKLRQLLPTTVTCEGYGSTEGGFLCVFNSNKKDRELMSKNLDSMGRPCPGVWYKIADVNTGEALGPGKKGELCVKGDGVMAGYYKRDSADAFDNEGFLKTGDIIYYDEDYCFYFVDRIKNLIKYRMFHVSPLALENVIEQHPAVQQATAIGIPNEKDGEHPLAIVQLKKGYQDVTPEEIVSFVDERVDDSMRLRAGVKIINEFPLTSTGKIQRLHLRKLISEGAV